MPTFNKWVCSSCDAKTSEHTINMRLLATAVICNDTGSKTSMSLQTILTSAEETSNINIGCLKGRNPNMFDSAILNSA